MQEARANLKRQAIRQERSSITPVFGERSRQLPLSASALHTIKRSSHIPIPTIPSRSTGFIDARLGYFMSAFLRCFYAALLIFLAFGRVVLAETSKATNVVLIVIDDLGWRDLGCQGSEFYRTPHIDRLASEGVRFTDAYAACNVCSPTRASILTGKYPARLQLTQWLPAGRWNAKEHRLREARYVRELPLEEVTLAEALREHGYTTGFVGKWHLGGTPFYLPEHQGFDVNVAGEDHGAPGHYFFPYKGSWLIPTTGRRVVKQTLKDGEPGEYLIDRLSQEAVGFIRKNASSPFFLMLSHYGVHTPLQAKKSMVAPYDLIPESKRQGEPAYAAMVESVDQSVGNVMRILRELDLENNTLVLFTSDNGGFARATSNAPLRANKGSNYEGGLRVPLIASGAGVTARGTVSRAPVITNDIYPTVLDALKWPLRPHQHLDGISLLPALRGDDLPQRDLFWHYPHYNRHPSSAPSGVIRSGKWKLMEFFESGKRMLFDLESDISESVDLSESHRKLSETLYQRLRAWRTAVRADLMQANPEYEGL